MNKHVIVIGGGLGGLSAAIRLAHFGFSVKLFEQNENLGGKMNHFSRNGYSFDTGPSLLTMPFVIDELFAEVGQNREDYLKFVPIDPICRYFWMDGSILNASGDSTTMQSEIAKFSKSDAENYFSFLNYSKRIYDLTADIFLFHPIHEMNKVFNYRNFKTLLKIFQIDPLRTVHEGVSRFFQHPKIIQLFDRYATYNGSDPFRAPATLNIIPYVEYGLGSYYIKGGMYQLVQALEALAQQNGVEIHKSCRVNKILQHNNQLTGVSVNGESLKADYVVCNSDVVTTHNELIEDFPKRREQLQKLEPSLSGLVFLWGVRNSHQQLAQHNILFSENYFSEFEQIFIRGKIPEEPTIYITITKKADTLHAPEGCENWFVLINVPYLSNQQFGNVEIERIRKTIFSRLKKIGVDVAASIEVEHIITPVNFYQQYKSNRGSIYGISSNQKSTAFRRPANRSREISGLYFAGGSSHPGGGVPLVLLSGKICADLIKEGHFKR